MELNVSYSSTAQLEPRDLASRVAHELRGTSRAKHILRHRHCTRFTLAAEHPKRVATLLYAVDRRQLGAVVIANVRAQLLGGWRPGSCRWSGLRLIGPGCDRCGLAQVGIRDRRCNAVGVGAGGVAQYYDAQALLREVHHERTESGIASRVTPGLAPAVHRAYDRECVRKRVALVEEAALAHLRNRRGTTDLPGLEVIEPAGEVTRSCEQRGRTLVRVAEHCVAPAVVGTCRI